MFSLVYVIHVSESTCRSCFSCVKHNIWEPTMLAQDWRVNTVLMNGSFSPWRCTIDAIWITGSLSASGKIPGSESVNSRIRLYSLPLITSDQTMFTLSGRRYRNRPTFSSCTLNVKAEDPEWCNPLPVSFSWVTYQIGPSHIHLILTQGCLKGKIHECQVYIK